MVAVVDSDVDSKYSESAAAGGFTGAIERSIPSPSVRFKCLKKDVD